PSPAANMPVVTVPATAAQNQPTLSPIAQNPPTPVQPAVVIQATPNPTAVEPPTMGGEKNKMPKAAPASPAKTSAQKKTMAGMKPKPRTVMAIPPKPIGSATEKAMGITSISPPSAAVPAISSVATGSVSENSIWLRRTNEEIFAINPDLGAAYQALVAGRLLEARQQYEMVLQKDPANIDAELGLATISAKNNDTADAAHRYRRVLELSPKNPYAIAGNAALVNDLPQTENQLRAQIAQQPQSAPLTAALGNVFAAQGRWNEAQQAYFDAARIDANHPDYIFNLAVSLDQINQPKLALENYQKALALANVRPSQFSKDAVAARIAELYRYK
ncbi:MAG: tetratricopeptide repeat protein, partial [Burkholderiales bacterium]